VSNVTVPFSFCNPIGAVSYGYSNIFVTAPSPENLKTVFQFVINGLKALKYSEHLDFEVGKSTPYLSALLR
jgi:tRNA(Met) C34 N-acetyltransferase TmcA